MPDMLSWSSLRCTSLLRFRSGCMLCLGLT
jgi:hypothetical protein